MKKLKLIPALLIILALPLVTQAQPHERALDYFVQAFKDAGFEMGEIETTNFYLLGAVDGVAFRFYSDGRPIGVYEFSDVSALAQSIEIFPYLSDGTSITNGRFLIGTNVAEAREFFATIEIPEHINTLVSQPEYGPLTADELRKLAELQRILMEQIGEQ